MYIIIYVIFILAIHYYYRIAIFYNRNLPQAPGNEIVPRCSLFLAIGSADRTA
jgi:hypothetical protein